MPNDLCGKRLNGMLGGLHIHPEPKFAAGPGCYRADGGDGDTLEKMDEPVLADHGGEVFNGR